MEQKITWLDHLANDTGQYYDDASSNHSFSGPSLKVSKFLLLPSLIDLSMET